MVMLATAGQRHEAPMLPRLLQGGAVKRPGRGRPRLRPDAVAADKGYSYPSVRRYLQRRGIRAVIPSKSNQSRQRIFDTIAYRERNQVERTINRLKGFRRVATTTRRVRSTTWPWSRSPRSCRCGWTDIANTP
jgi:transposase